MGISLPGDGDYTPLRKFHLTIGRILGTTHNEGLKNVSETYHSQTSKDEGGR